MELSLKQKVAVFGIMAVVFLGSAAVKQGVFSHEDGSDGAGITVAADEGSGEDEDVTSAQAEPEVLIVDVEGAVVYPGIVKLDSGSRVYEAVDKAGGILDTADTRYVNLAEEVSDGTVIYIPFEGENDETSGGPASDPGGGNGLVNINTADKTELMTLPGVGEATAQAIIDYRETSGSFKTKEDIKNVSGIGDAKYAKVESLITAY